MARDKSERGEWEWPRDSHGDGYGDGGSEHGH